MAFKRKSEDGIEEPCVGQPTALHLKGYFADRKGERDEMQDEHVILDNFLEIFPVNPCSQIKRLAYYGVFDGHSGAKASKYCAENLHLILAQLFPKNDSLPYIEQNLKRCFIETYKKIDDDFLNEARKVKPVLKDGTTATAVLIINNCLYATNLGDSRAILCRYKDTKEIALPLTVDHSPTVFNERMRIQKVGGIVKDGRVMGQLEVSRSIGDGQYKNHGVTCVPDIKRCTLTDQDRYVLIACDGLWKTFSNSDALTFIAKTREDLKKDESLTGSVERSLKDVRNELLCSRLASEAVRRGSGDNVTVVLITVNELDDC